MFRKARTSISRPSHEHLAAATGTGEALVQAARLGESAQRGGSDTMAGQWLTW